MGSLAVVSGGSAMCPFGTAPGTINATSQVTCMACGKPIATIKDVSPNINVTSFGLCTSLANPQVASATAAALGVLTPQPCTMTPIGTWIPTKPTTLVGGAPCLTNDSQLVCGMGLGTICITSPGQTTVVL